MKSTMEIQPTSYILEGKPSTNPGQFIRKKTNKTDFIQMQKVGEMRQLLHEEN